MGMDLRSFRRERLLASGLLRPASPVETSAVATQHPQMPKPGPAQPEAMSQAPADVSWLPAEKKALRTA